MTTTRGRCDGSGAEGIRGAARLRDPRRLAERVHRRAAPGRRVAWQHMRHEEAAAFAAPPRPRSPASWPCAPASCGPGNLHLINGLFDAQRSRVPVLAIAAHIPSRGDRRASYFQETHPAGAVPRVQRVLRAGRPSGADAADPARSRCARRSSAAAWPWSSSRRDLPGRRAGRPSRRRRRAGDAGHPADRRGARRRRGAC